MPRTKLIGTRIRKALQLRNGLILFNIFSGLLSISRCPACSARFLLLHQCNPEIALQIHEESLEAVGWRKGRLFSISVSS
jgi:hypothetical protein